WKELGDPPNVWRCRDNPSCRLLLGGPEAARPAEFDGPLVERLRARAETADRDVQWSYATLPVTWEIATTEPDYAAYDVVVHIGLGVYDRTDTVFVEDGAYNGRRGTDAAGRSIDAPISTALTGDVLAVPAASPIAQRVADIDGRTFGGYRVEVKAARRENAFLCNETHFVALQAVHDSVADGGRLQQAYFVHIPFADNEDYAALADGIAGVVAALVL
ncbi:MAG: hypothetical protein AAF721_42375, partial [Myxococcota bacterium]